MSFTIISPLVLVTTFIFFNNHLVEASNQLRNEGGLLTIQNLIDEGRSFCREIETLAASVNKFPLSSVSNVMEEIPIPMINPFILDKLHMFSKFTGFAEKIQDLGNSLSGFNRKYLKIGGTTTTTTTTTRKPGLFSWRQLSGNVDSTSKKPTTTRKPGSTTKKTETFLRTSDIIKLNEEICPMLDTVESLMTQSIFRFLKLQNIPIPLPNGKQKINPLKALDIFNILGKVDKVRGITTTSKPTKKPNALEAIVDTLEKKTTTKPPAVTQKKSEGMFEEVLDKLERKTTPTTTTTTTTTTKPPSGGIFGKLEEEVARKGHPTTPTTTTTRTTTKAPLVGGVVGKIASEAEDTVEKFIPKFR